MSRKKSNQTGQKQAAAPKKEPEGADLQALQDADRDAPAEQQQVKQTGRGETVQETEQPEPAGQQQARLEAENQELREALLRKQADFENYRRRMQKDKEEAIQFANRSLISELLEVLDNFERALDSHQQDKDSGPAMKGLFEGLELVEKQLRDTLSGRWGLQPIDCVGQEFDPNMHEALMMEESTECEVATVLENFQTGYTLHGKVLRPARVKVAKPAGA